MGTGIARFSIASPRLTGYSRYIHWNISLHAMNFIKRIFRIGSAAILIAGIACAHGPVARAESGPLVFAAASLTDALNAVGEAYAATGQVRPVFSFAATSALARQIENGAPADVFISADLQWMDYLQHRGLVDIQSRIDVLANDLVLIVPLHSRLDLVIAKGFPLAEALGDGRLALADPTSVPAGRYAMAALESLGLWSAVEAKVVRADNVRTALAFVARGEAAAGIVYASDAASTDDVVTVGSFPPDSHPPIVYPLAVISGRSTPHIAALVEFISSPIAADIFRNYGFSPVGHPASPRTK